MAENELEKKRRTGQNADTGNEQNEPHRGDQTLTPDHNRSEDATPAEPRKTNPGKGFTVDPTINPDMGATKQW